MLYVGGRYTMWGALIAAPILWGLPQWVPQRIGELTNILYGAMLVLILLLRPQGLINRELLQRLRTLFRAGTG
jgi:ABC-type branched-subunit amino acid transport system permease subunit